MRALGSLTAPGLPDSGRKLVDPARQDVWPALLGGLRDSLGHIGHPISERGGLPRLGASLNYALARTL